MGALILGIRTGFCGALSTFASWNNQMVEMATCGNSGVAKAIFGYIVGLSMPLSFYEFGIHFATWIRRHLKQQADRLAEGVATVEPTLQMDCVGQEPESLDRGMLFGPGLWNGMAVVIISASVVSLSIGFVNTDTYFWSKFCLCGLFAPAGVFLRYELSAMNGKLLPTWFPWGTFAANLIAGIIINGTVDVLLQVGPLEEASSMDIGPLLLAACSTGFAGSLSTISTFIAECHALFDRQNARRRGYIYALTSVFLACAVTLCYEGWSIWAFPSNNKCGH